MMPNKKSAEKRVRTSERNRIYNRFWTTRCKNSTRKVLEAVEAKDMEMAVKRLDEAQSALDKAVVKGVIHRNTAARRKSRLTRAVKSLAPQA
jgi:small subunit ribosomal protein S20